MRPITVELLPREASNLVGLLEAVAAARLKRGQKADVTLAIARKVDEAIHDAMEAEQILPERTPRR